MPAGATYDLISTQTISSAGTTVTFSSIPGTYRDLVLIIYPKATTAADIRFRFNGDTNANYRARFASGDSGTLYSSFGSFLTSCSATAYAATATTAGNSMHKIEIMSYSNTNTYKPVLCHSGDSTARDIIANIWKSTSAITSITLGGDSSLNAIFATGSIFSLYGIASANA